MRILNSFLFLLPFLCTVYAQFAFLDSVKKFFWGERNAVTQSSTGVSPTDSIATKTLDDARSLIVAQDFDEAVKLLLPLIDINPDDKDVNMLLGSSFLALNRADMAENFLYHAVKLTDWSEVTAVSNLAEAIRQNGDLPLAEKILQKGYVALNNTDKTGQLAYQFGTIQEQLENYTSAAEWYLSSALSENGDSRAWLKASTLLFPAKHWDLALAETILASGVKANPSNPALIFNLGVVMHYTNRFNEAVLLYKEALKKDPLHYAAMSNLATALHSLGEVNSAHMLYESVYDATFSNISGQIIDPYPGTATALGNYALLLSSMNRVHQAAAVATRAVQLDPESKSLISVRDQCSAVATETTRTVEEWRTKIRIAVTSGKWSEGIELLVSTGPPVEDDAWWYFTKGMLHYFRYFTFMY